MQLLKQIACWPVAYICLSVSLVLICYGALECFHARTYTCLSALLLLLTDFAHSAVFSCWRTKTLPYVVLYAWQCWSLLWQYTTSHHQQVSHEGQLMYIFSSDGWLTGRCVCCECIGLYRSSCCQQIRGYVGNNSALCLCIL